MLSIVFCVSHNLQPVRIQVGWSLLIHECTLGPKAHTPGVEQGKELSLLVEEQSSPKSRSMRADTDGPQPVTYVYLWLL